MKKLLVILVVLATILSACAAPPRVTPVAVLQQPTTGEQPADAAESVVHTAPAGWEVHQRPSIGLSFAMPPGSVLQQDSAMPPWYSLVVPVSDFPDGNVVSVGIEGNYELPDGMPLETWVDMRYAVGEWPIEVASSRWIALGQGGDERQGLMVEIGPAGPAGYVLYLVHGNLVLIVQGPGTEAMARFLPELAATIELADSAPTTLDELYGAHQARLSLLDRYQGVIAAQSATPALDIVALDATAAAQITPGPQATYSPQMQTQEAAFYQSLETATAVARLTPPAPTSTPIPTATLIPAGQPGFAIHRGTSGYPDQPAFEVMYKTGAWQLSTSEASQLVNRELADCVLNLRDGGREMLGPAVVDWATLGGARWTRTDWRGNHVINYILEEPGAYFIIGVYYPTSASREGVDACRMAAEEVLDTFKLSERADE